jgi:hypothetical protein
MEKVFSRRLAKPLIRQKARTWLRAISPGKTKDG